MYCISTIIKCNYWHDSKCKISQQAAFIKMQNGRYLLVMLHGWIVELYSQTCSVTFTVVMMLSAGCDIAGAWASRANPDIPLHRPVPRSYLETPRAWSSWVEAKVPQAATWQLCSSAQEEGRLHDRAVNALEDFLNPLGTMLTLLSVSLSHSSTHPFIFKTFTASVVCIRLRKIKHRFVRTLQDGHLMSTFHILFYHWSIVRRNETDIILNVLKSVSPPSHERQIIFEGWGYPPIEGHMHRFAH